MIFQKPVNGIAKITGVSPYFNESFYTGFDISGCELGLDPDLTSIGTGEHSVAYWSVDDIEDAVKNLIANGATVLNAINEVGDGIKVAIVKDPFGNSIGLIEESHIAFNVQL